MQNLVFHPEEIKALKRQKIHQVETPISKFTPCQQKGKKLQIFMERKNQTQKYYQ